MAKFLSVPTQATGQPILLFNTDNITTVTPPVVGDTSGTGLYCTLWSQGKQFRLTFGGTSTTTQNANAIAGANAVSNAIASASTAPITSVVNFNPVVLVGASGAISQTNITVPSTTGLVPGMVLTITSGSASGVFPANTVISSITSPTVFVVSAAPTTALSGATISAATLTVTAVSVG